MKYLTFALTSSGTMPLLLGERLAGAHFDAVFSSPLVRAVRTAAEVCRRLDGQPEIELLPQIIENGSSYGYFGESVEYLSRYYDRLKPNTDLPLMYDNLEDSDNDARARAVIDYFKSRFTYGQKSLFSPTAPSAIIFCRRLWKWARAITFSASTIQVFRR